MLQKHNLRAAPVGPNYVETPESIGSAVYTGGVPDTTDGTTAGAISSEEIEVAEVGKEQKSQQAQQAAGESQIKNSSSKKKNSSSKLSHEPTFADMVEAANKEKR